jgi:hypothetical protein
VTIDCHGASGSGAAGYLNQSIPASPYFGIQASCDGSCTQAGTGGLVFGVSGVTLQVQENAGPSVTPAESNDFFNQTGYVRGAFPASFNASDVSGICGMQTQINGVVVNSSSETPDTSNWQQCPDGTLTASVDTNKYYFNDSGSISVLYSASNAAGVVTTVSRTINVDNFPVSVALTGPTQAPSTAGTQYITATATVGPSGSNIFCSVDGGPEVEYPGPVAHVPVSGLGAHQASCYAVNNSVDQSGTPLRSITQTFDMSIGQPTAEAVTFSKIVGLHCYRRTVHVKLRGRERVVKRHGKTVELPGRIHRVTRHVRRCGGRIVRKRVMVVVTRHGKNVKIRKVEKVVIPPHVVDKSTKRVAHGKGTTVSGILLTTDGTALGGRTVDILTAPNNDLGQWTRAASVVTGPDGTWTTTLPPGPSRLVEASYGGDSTTLPSTSTTIHLLVPAKVKIHLSRRSTRWGGKITISGRVLGGYIPAGKLLRLRIGVEGVRTTAGIPSVGRKGRFRTTWTFSSGRGVVRYWFSVSTLNEADYPYAPASSRRVYVRVGPG